MTRTLAHSLNQIATKNKWNFELWSVYDSPADLMPQYLPGNNFKAFSADRAGFAMKTLMSATWPDIIIITHVHLAVVGLIVKTVNPKCKIWLIAHGIEVWRPLSVSQRLMLKICNKIVCVSNFTKQQMITRHNADEKKCEVLNNAVDTFMKLPVSFEKPRALLEKYRITENNPVIFTLSRLASTEQYKGHDHVIKVMSRLKQSFPEIRYILAGKHDHKEEIRIQKLISAHNVDKEIILTDFLSEDELTDHFLLADLFVLPSKKEGFGIVFIEALACGLPVVCGNADGSVDAIDHGRLGTAINTDDLDELEMAIKDSLKQPLTEAKRKFLQLECLKLFNETDYMNKIEKLIVNG